MRVWIPLVVTVIHPIHDPKGFEAAEAKELEAGLPSHVALPIHASIDDHTFGICIWEGESVESIREVVEGAVGQWANNEYIEMHVDALVPQLARTHLPPWGWTQRRSLERVCLNTGSGTCCTYLGSPPFRLPLTAVYLEVTYHDLAS